LIESLGEHDVIWSKKLNGSFSTKKAYELVSDMLMIPRIPRSNPLENHSPTKREYVFMFTCNCIHEVNNISMLYIHPLCQP